MKVDRKLKIGLTLCGVILLLFSTFSAASGAIKEIESKTDSFASEGVFEEGPIEIHDWYDLDAVRDNLSADYVLMSDLDEATDGYDEFVDTENGWEPIGGHGEQDNFTGTFYGQEYEIRDLYINRTNENYVGLFGCTDYGSEVKSLSVIDADMSGDSFVGGLVGRNSGTVSESYATGKVSGYESVGGLVGRNDESNITYSYATGNVSGEWYTGGLVGRNSGMVSNSYATGSVTGYWFGGGLVGYNVDMVENSFWDMNTTGYDGSMGGTGKTTEEMKDVSTFTDLSTEGLDEPWDFVGDPYDDEGDEDIWDIHDSINDGYPFFTWEPSAIYDWYDLDAVQNDLDGDYFLMNDIDENTEGYDELLDTEEGWEPVGEVDNEFTGTFNGNGYEIRDLYINRPDRDAVGLFGVLEGEIVNTKVVGADVTGYGSVGALVGYSREWSIIEDSHTEGDITGIGDVGGLVGYLSRGSIRNSSSATEVSGEVNIGGLVGRNQDRIFESYAEGDVDGDVQAGGLIGYDLEGWIKNTYATGDVNGNEYIGGLVGLEETSEISKSYATGNVSGEDYQGGLIGYNIGTFVKDSFWDMNTMGQNESMGGTGKTTGEMKDVATFTNLSTEGLDDPWDFVGDPYDDDGDEDIWDVDEEGVINEGYPVLFWEDIEEPEVYNLTVYIEGQGSVEVNGQIVEYGWTGEFDEDEYVTAEAMADQDWSFANWTGDVPAGQEGDQITITMDKDRVITACFEEKEEPAEYLLIIGVEEEGTTDPPPGEHEFEEGEEIELEALAGEGHHFVEWTGDNGTIGETTANQTIIEMNDNYSITAEFEINTYSLDASSTAGGGVIDPGEGTFEYEHGTEVGLEAVADEDHHFVEWTGDNETIEDVEAAQTNIVMDSDKEITAHFEELEAEEYYLLFVIEDEKGDPIEGANIIIDGTENITDENGEAVSKNMEPGTYDYEISHEGYENVEGSVEITDEDITEKVTLEKIETTYTLTFVVEDEEGDPIEGANIEIDSTENITDENGEAVFKNLESGTYNYTVEREGYETVEGEVTIDEGNLTKEVTLEVATCELMVEVRDEEDSPIEGAEVTVGDETVETDENGEAVFKDLDPDTYHYIVEKDGYEAADGDLDIEEDNQTFQITLEKQRETTGFWPWIVLAAILAVAIALSAFMMKKRAEISNEEGIEDEES